MTANRMCRWIGALCFPLALAAVSQPAIGEDSQWLYGIHWYGAPGSNLCEEMTGGKGIWSLETVLTEDAYWGLDNQWTKLSTAYNRGHTLIIRVQPRWGLNVPGDESAENSADRMSTFLSKLEDIVEDCADICHIWQVGNEQNLGGEYDIGNMTPELYIEKYIEIRETIKEVSSSLGEQIVLVSPVSPLDNAYLGAMCDELASEEVVPDGFALHGYRSVVLDQIKQQADLLDSKGYENLPFYVTEWGAPVDPIGDTNEANVAQYLRGVFWDLHQYNQNPDNHDIVCACWFVYAHDTVWNKWSILDMHDLHNPGPDYDLYDSFQLACTWNLPAGDDYAGSATDPFITRSPAVLTPEVVEGNDATSASFTVENTGVGTLEYTITDNVSWLSVSPTSGTSTGEEDTITVNYDTDALDVGEYPATITISDVDAANNPVTIGVTLTVTASQTPPDIDNPDFEDNNGGWNGAAIDWTAFGGNKWEGVYDGGGRVWVQGLSEYPPNSVCGVYQQITVTDGTTYLVTVDAKVGNTDLDVSIGADADGGTAVGGATFGDTSNSTSWNSREYEFTADGTTSTIFLRGRNPNGWWVSGGWAFFDGVEIEITGTGGGTPTIDKSTSSLSPSTLEGTDAASSSFTVANSGSGTLNYTITDNVSWLDVSPGSGTSTDETDTATVNYSTSELSDGTHYATITISDSNASNNPQTISVTLTVTSDTTPAISVTPQSLSPATLEGNDAGDGSFTVANVGGGTLSYSIGDNQSWLSVAPSSGTSTGESDTITVSYDTDSLSDGSYSATITITDANASNSPQTIAVSLTVNPQGGGGPNLVVNPSFEGSFSSGLAASWSSWSTAGTGYNKQSALLGRIGSGMYSGTAGYSATLALNPKVVLFHDLALGQGPGIRSQLPDAILVGRMYIDTLTNKYLYDDSEDPGNAPEYWGAEHADDCYAIHTDKSSVFDAWQGMNEQFNSAQSEDKARRVARFEKAFAERCHELGLKAVVLNIAVGNPGDVSFMEFQEVRDCLAVADYVGYHAYGGINDQLMIGPEQEDFSLRWRKYVDTYQQNGWRMPPCIYTECTTFYGWQSNEDISAADVRDDLQAFEAESKLDPWSVGMTIFVVGSGQSQWDDWETATESTIIDGCGDYNEDHPADAWDGLYSQQFGETSGGYTGGIVQAVTTTNGASYRLDHWMKYETYGVDTDLSYRVGYDLTGQTGNASAGTINWSSDLIDTEDRETDWWYSHTTTFQATGSSVSIWFKGSQPSGNDTWRVMVDKVSLQSISTGNDPVISVSPTSLSPSTEEGGSPAGQTFTVQNTGAGTLNYSITDNVTWLSVTQTSGSSTGEADTINVNYNTSDLPSGSYNATITVSDPNATNDPQTVAVTLNVSSTGTPAITLSKTSLTPSATVGSSPSNDTFTVSNSGGGTLSYSVNDNQTWLSVSPTSGSSTGEADTITVSYSTASLSADTYDATITVSDSNASNNPQTIAVDLAITAPFSGEENGNFEGGSFNDPDGDHKSPNDWTRFSISGASKAGVPWLGSACHSPNYCYEVYESSWVAGIYQQISGATDDVNYTASVWVKGDTDIRFWVGIDPNGGTSATSNDIEWSSQSQPGGTWTQISKQVEANGSTITVFLKAQNPYGINEYARFDDVNVTTP